MVDRAAQLVEPVPTAGRIAGPRGLAERGRERREHGGREPEPCPAVGCIAPPPTIPLAVIYDADGAVLDAVLGRLYQRPEQLRELWSDHVDRPLQSRRHHRPCGDGAQRPLRDHREPGLDDAVSAGASVREDSGPGLCPGQSGCAAQGRCAAAPQGWPIMQPGSGVCGPAGGTCIPDPDDSAF